MDTDLALALQLQQEYDAEQAAEEEDAVIPADVATSPISSRPELSPVDPQWETLDPNPDIRALFIAFNQRYFWGKLDMVEVRWSPRMTLCAGLCVYEGKGGLCSVRLSLPLLKLRPRKDLIETLLHEMIHALLFVTDNNKDHDGHGPEFHKHMHRINKEAKSNISVYHNFHDEVESYRVHWWKCNGPCQKRPPYFGMVKRTMNRPPSPRDTWWAEHQRTCGGTYTKVKEPEGFGEKKSKKMEKVKETPKPGPDIRNFLGSKSESGSKDGKKSQVPMGNKDGDKKKGIQVFAGQGEENEPKVKQSWTAVPDNNVMTAVTINSVKKPERPVFTGSGQALGNSGQNSGSGKTLNDAGPANGSGHMLGGARSPEQGVIVRRIPGIGIITSARPSATVTSEHGKPSAGQGGFAVSRSDFSSSDGPISSQPPLSNESKFISPTKNQGVSSNAKRQSILEGVDVSDSEDFLPTPRHRQSPGQHRSRSGEFNSATPPGTTVTIPGFRSVCAGHSSDRRHMNSVAIDHARSARGEPHGKSANGRGIKGMGKNKPRTGDFGSANPNDKKRPKRPNNTNNFAADRNKRVLLDSSDSDIDDEEFTPLITAAKKPAAKAKRTDSDSDEEFIPKKIKIDSGSNNIYNPSVLLDSDLEDDYKPPVKYDFDNNFSNDKSKSPSMIDQDPYDLPHKNFLDPVRQENNIQEQPQSWGSVELLDDPVYNTIAPSVHDATDPLVDCPACTLKIRQSSINEHLDLCLQ